MALHVCDGCARKLPKNRNGDHFEEAGAGWWITPCFAALAFDHGLGLPVVALAEVLPLVPDGVLAPVAVATVAPMGAGGETGEWRGVHVDTIATDGADGHDNRTDGVCRPVSGRSATS